MTRIVSLAQPEVASLLHRCPVLVLRSEPPNRSAVNSFENSKKLDRAPVRLKVSPTQCKNKIAHTESLRYQY